MRICFSLYVVLEKCGKALARYAASWHSEYFQKIKSQNQFSQLMSLQVECRFYPIGSQERRRLKVPASSAQVSSVDTPSAAAWSWSSAMAEAAYPALAGTLGLRRAASVCLNASACQELTFKSKTAFCWYCLFFNFFRTYFSVFIVDYSECVSV